MMPKTLLAALACATLTLASGCANTPAQPRTITETVSARPELSTLNRLLVNAGMAETLRGTGPFTLFAPTDEAFKAVPAKTMSELSANPELLKSVLGFHAVAGAMPAAKVNNGKAKSVQGAELNLAKAGGFVTVEEAVVVSPDVMASNGVVHVVDRVLMPPKR